MKPEMTIVIIHWNTPDLLKKQLKILTQDNNSQIIVIDNASKEKLSFLKQEFPQVEFIENQFNRGYAFAGNQGAVKGIGEWFLFLNPDVEINPWEIKMMIKHAEKMNLDAASPETKTPDYNKPIPSWQSLLIEFTPLNKFLSLNLFPLKTLIGGCLLIKKKVFFEIGGFDERFFLWFEDSDLTYRLIKNKYNLGTIPLNIKHEGGKSFKQLNNQYKYDIFFNSMEIYAKKHFSFWGEIIIFLIKRKYTKRKLLPEIQNIVSITIPNLKKQLLQDFFIKNQKIIDTIDELIIVSSALDNENIWSWRKKYPKIRFISIEQNQGFAKTVNIGFRVSTGKWIGAINDDIILTDNWLKNTLKCTSPNTGSLGLVVYKKDGSIESVGIDILKKGKAQVINKIPKKLDCLETEVNNGACVLYSKEALNKVGLFDEQFGSYLEDIDLSLRLKNKGFKNIVVLKSKVIHYGQSTSRRMGRKKRILDARNWLYVIFKNWSLKDLFLNAPKILIERLRNFWGVIKSE